MGHQHFTETQYGVVAARRLALDGLMWQVPSLSLAAQAFLLTVSLNVAIEPVSRLVAAIIGVVVTAASAQLMVKHRRHELIDRLLLEKMEASLGLPKVHSSPAVLAAGLGMARANWFVRIRSFAVWLAMLILLGFVSAAAGAVAILNLIL
ncbi:MAG: hypothetical protein SFU54_03365 [Microcella sp.]|nr:hypothetical protein [Microcella sp.]